MLIRVYLILFKVYFFYKFCRSSHPRCYLRKVFLKICVVVSFLIKLQTSGTPFKNTFFWQNSSRRLLHKFLRRGHLKPIPSLAVTWKLQVNKGAVSGLKQFLVTENPLKLMKNAFGLTLKVLFVLKIFNLFQRFAM